MGDYDFHNSLNIIIYKQHSRNRNIEHHTIPDSSMRTDGIRRKNTQREAGR